MRILFTATVAAVAFVAGSALAQEDKVVNVYNWSDYIDESILEEFTKETGIKVVYDVFDSNEVLETKLLAGGTGYDVVVPTGSFLARQIKAGVFMKLDKSKLPNLKNMWPEIQERVQKYDPGNEYSGQLHVGHDRVRLQSENGQGSLRRRGSPGRQLGSAVQAGKRREAVQVRHLRAGCRRPRSSRPRSTIWAMTPTARIRTRSARRRRFGRRSVPTSASSTIPSTSTRWPTAISAWRSAGRADVLQARDRAAEADNGVTVDFSIPKQGALMWFDQMAIPADAPHPENALAFLNYIMKPEVIAKASNYVYYANGNLASQKFLNDDVINDPAIYPSAEAMKHLSTRSPTTRRR